MGAQLHGVWKAAAVRSESSMCAPLLMRCFVGLLVAGAAGAGSFWWCLITLKKEAVVQAGDQAWLATGDAGMREQRAVRLSDECDALEWMFKQYVHHTNVPDDKHLNTRPPLMMKLPTFRSYNTLPAA